MLFLSPVGRVRLLTCGLWFKWNGGSALEWCDAGGLHWSGFFFLLVVVPNSQWWVGVQAVYINRSDPSTSNGSQACMAGRCVVVGVMALPIPLRGLPGKVVPGYIPLSACLTTATEQKQVGCGSYASSNSTQWDQVMMLKGAAFR